MAGMDRDLFSPLGVFFLLFYGTESIVSLLGNGFILVVSGHSWLRSKKTPLCDFLLTNLSLSRFLSQWIALSGRIGYFSSPETYLDSEKRLAIEVTWAYLNTASLWCATGLNVFYCVKVTNFAHPFFAWLKLRIGMLVPRCLGICLLAFIICSIYPVMICFQKCSNITGNLSEYTSQCEALGTNCTRSLNGLQSFFTALSVSICVSSSVLLLASLWRHTRNLKKGSLSTKDLSIKAHLSVMQPLLLSLFFYILHFAAMIVALFNVFKYGKLEHLICDIFISLYPSAHSVILIFTNPKLREVCTRVLNLRRSAS